MELIADKKRKFRTCHKLLLLITFSQWAFFLCYCSAVFSCSMLKAHKRQLMAPKTWAASVSVCMQGVCSYLLLLSKIVTLSTATVALLLLCVYSMYSLFTIIMQV